MIRNRRSVGRTILAFLFAAASLNALAQVALVPLGRSSDPAALVALQIAVGVSGAAAAWGSWATTVWAPVAALLYGMATATLIVALESVLDLGPEARGGLWVAAAGILVFAALAAWYLRRSGVARSAPV